MSTVITWLAGFSEVLTIQTKGAAQSAAMIMPSSQIGTSLTIKRVPGSRRLSSLPTRGLAQQQPLQERQDQHDKEKQHRYCRRVTQEVSYDRRLVDVVDH